jgi:hypothetical protein
MATLPTILFCGARSSLELDATLEGVSKQAEEPRNRSVVARALVPLASQAALRARASQEPALEAANSGCFRPTASSRASAGGIARSAAT